MSNDGIRRKCPKCRGTDIKEPHYLEEDNRLRYVCPCGYFWTTPTKEQTMIELRSAQVNRSKLDE